MTTPEAFANNADFAKRCEDALFIDAGACNPRAITRTILRTMDAMAEKGADHGVIRNDPAIRLMLHQLAFLCGVDRMCWDGYSLPDSEYSTARVACQTIVAAHKREKAAPTQP